jgi:hypothetical protein
MSTAMKKLRLFIFFCFTTSAVSASAAEAVYPLITYKCNQEADMLTLTNSLLQSDEGATYQYSDEDGTYSPWNLVEIDRKSERTSIVRTSKINRSCKLSTGEYPVSLEPQVFSRDLDSTYGASISSAFIITYDGLDIQERTPFEDFCRGNSPIITRVTVFGKTREVKIKRVPRFSFY